MIRLVAEITLCDQFNIGSGRLSSRGADISIALHGDGRLPPSTLKGVLRKAANRAAPIADPSWRPCPYIEPREIIEKCSPGRREYRWLSIFGYPGMRGHTTPRLIIKDFRVAFPRNPSPHVYTHVSIDPKTMTRKKGALYKVEYLPPYTRLHATLLVEEEPETLRLVLLSLLYLPLVGIGRKSRNIKVRLLEPRDIANHPLVKKDPVAGKAAEALSSGQGFDLFSAIGGCGP